MTARPSREFTDADFHFLRELVHRTSGTLLGLDQHYLVETRLLDHAAEHGFASLGSLVAQLRTEAPDSPLRKLAVEAMLNGETRFFRDAAAFAALRSVVIPELVERRAGERRLTIWSAACSTGQEPYSIAMLLHGSFPELVDWNVRILATDLSSAALRRARAGRYSQFEVNRGLPAVALIRYFEQEGNDWVVRDDLRRLVEFEEFNLLTDWPGFVGVDLVLLRNVMIYWDVECKRRMLGRLTSILRPDGHLMLGAAETTYFVENRFERNDESGTFQLARSKSEVPE